MSVIVGRNLLLGQCQTLETWRFVRVVWSESLYLQPMNSSVRSGVTGDVHGQLLARSIGGESELNAVIVLIEQISQELNAESRSTPDRHLAGIWGIRASSAGLSECKFKGEGAACTPLTVAHVR